MMVNGDGSMTDVPVVDENKAFSGFVGSCLDVTEKVEGFIMKEMAQKDGLTGIMSRQYLLTRLKTVFDVAKHSEFKLTIAMMDIDKFKLINDLYGHSEGDCALKMFASVVKDAIRQDDLFGRDGGDEFIIVFPNSSVEMADRILERISNALNKVCLNVGDHEVKLSISVGLCELTDEANFEEMISKADKIMYENKKNKYKLL